jgi:hypothetical protein
MSGDEREVESITESKTVTFGRQPDEDEAPAPESEPESAPAPAPAAPAPGSHDPTAPPPASEK